ncbi:MAG: hypothetical protein ACYTE2_03205 [Planctomycetota bacterium]|jgi:flagellar basal body-associated protein FliL
MSTTAESVDAEVLLDDPEPGSSWFITIASIVVLVVLLVALAALFFNFSNAEFDRKVVDQPAKRLMELRNEQNLMLAESGEYTDPDTGVAKRRIPIQAAMEQIAAQHGGG